MSILYLSRFEALVSLSQNEQLDIPTRWPLFPSEHFSTFPWGSIRMPTQSARARRELLMWLLFWVFLLWVSTYAHLCISFTSSVDDGRNVANFRIENYSILLATCATIIRLLVSSVSNNESTSKDYPGSGNRSGGASQGLELNTVAHTHNQNTLGLTMPVQDTQKGHHSSRAECMGIPHGTSVVIRTDIHFDFASQKDHLRDASWTN
ncbi:hypothetical protein BO82DRAFT_406072 [Aspergillus uvarum CBS 121591]|uniref:Uncharacterized protein n=1 Tax=Aspergillus uvarum CBS 121591 TaxID=1448315 RepID=A0A319DCP7_9EURO|nr:hypothetical protein BO82DRAFT_406072 [Aspergillus uvarum CBS 121591]PYH77642.1 hypothetical protein BO82DRAFT_406072 [Aspergillus uvarum CBS 121591]